MNAADEMPAAWQMKFNNAIAVSALCGSESTESGAGFRGTGI
jgi:hypothetical protein